MVAGAALDTCLLNQGPLQPKQASECRRGMSMTAAHSIRLLCMAQAIFSPDERLVVTGTSMTAAHSFRLLCMAQAIFSPDERLVVTGTSADRAGKGGAVVFFDAKTHELVRRVAMPSSAVGLAWHERLNQIFVGVGALSSNPRSRGVMGAMGFLL